MDDTQPHAQFTTPDTTLDIFADRVEVRTKDKSIAISAGDITDVKVRTPDNILRISTINGSTECMVGEKAIEARQAIFTMLAAYVPSPRSATPPPPKAAPARKTTAAARTASQPRDHPDFWWVNQGRTSEFEPSSGYLQSGTKSEIAHHANMLQLVPGDIVTHYASPNVYAVSRVSGHAQLVNVPDKIDTRGQGQRLRVQTEYFMLQNAILLEDIPREWRASYLGGPFNKNGQINQGYLYPLEESFVAQMRSRYAEIERLIKKMRGT